VVQLCVEDSAPPFNPLLAPEPDLTLPLDQRVPGGLGVHLVRKMMDHLAYQRAGGKNKLSMLKRF
jgi:serine/threonine-protein kinase RsbW